MSPSLCIMLPHQRNKVDISKLSPSEQQAFRLYGKLPSRAVAKSQPPERKYFDSGDWQLAKAGKQSHESVGKERPTPEDIPHASPSLIGSGGCASSAGSASSGGSPPSLGIGTIPLSSPGLGGSPGSGTPADLRSPVTSPTTLSAPGFDSGINLSMSPGRVGVGQPLATSPTRTMGSLPIVTGGGAANGAGSSAGPGLSGPMSPTGLNHNGSNNDNGLVNRLDRDTTIIAGTGSLVASGSGSSLCAQPPMVAATTGNQIGKTQVRRASQSENLPILGIPSSPPPTSGLANSYTAYEDTEDEEVGTMEL